MRQRLDRYKLRMYSIGGNLQSWGRLNMLSIKQSQQNQIMFRWCQSVNVYNIENHYHFYGEDAETKVIPKIVSGKLRPAAISVSSSKRQNQSRSCSKKGLQLSKMLSNADEPKNDEYTISTFTKQYSSMALNQINQQTLHHDKLVQSRLIQQPNSPRNSNFKSGYEVNGRQQAGSTPKDIKQKNQLLLTSLYSTKTTKNKQSPYNISNNGTNSTLINISKNSYVHHNLYNSQSRKKLKLEPNSSFVDQLLPQPQHPNQYRQQHRQYQHLRYQQKQQQQYKHKYQEQEPSSPENYQQHEQEQEQGISDRLYHRILEMSRGEAREASIILSNILSRSGHLSLSQNPKPPHMPKLSLQDKATILSQNDQSSTSLKIQQSLLYESDPKTNFHVLEKQFSTDSYTINLAIQTHLFCIVSLKQISFQFMSSISHQLQMYQFLSAHLCNSDVFRNVLGLYQVQITAGSYLFIKEPFTEFGGDWGRDRLKGSLENMLRSLLAEFAVHHVYPTRMLNLNDFVVCESVVKFHDMSAFKQMQSPIFDVEELVKHATDII